MRETSKANRRRVHDPLWHLVFRGVGLDIGCGNDPVNREHLFPAIKQLDLFDQRDGDASQILKHLAHREGAYDFVYSSHCLEHLHAPLDALGQWGTLVKPGGYLAIVVPDADLYEQGVWPSRFNSDHKYMFSLSRTLFEKFMINVVDLVKHFCAVQPFQLQHLRLADTNYDYALLGTGVDQTLGNAEANIEFVLKKSLDDRSS